MITETKTINDVNTPQKLTRKIGSTTYEVFIHFSKTSRETLNDKVIRLIRNETKLISNN